MTCRQPIAATQTERLLCCENSVTHCTSHVTRHTSHAITCTISILSFGPLTTHSAKATYNSTINANK